MHRLPLKAIKPLKRKTQWIWPRLKLKIEQFQWNKMNLVTLNVLIAHVSPVIHSMHAIIRQIYLQNLL